MRPRVRCSRPRASALALAGALWLLAGTPAARAASVTYKCPGNQEFQATFTPDRAHVQMNAQQWTLMRVRAAGAALYVNRKEGVSLQTQRRQAVLRIGPRELQCEFFIKP